MPATHENRSPTVPPLQPKSASLPKLHCLVKREDTILADLVATMPSGILAADRLYYLEVAATSDSTAHAFAGALTENRIEAQWRINGEPFCADWKTINIGPHTSLRDYRIEVPHWKGCLHHVAALDSSGELILADNDQTLWSKLRARMSCPTLAVWGESIIPKIHQSGLLIPATSFGLAIGLKAYVLAPDASELFDRIISSHVRISSDLQIRRALSVAKKGAA
jgi:hypothetical protein